jgi:hypothetical protein
MTRLRSQSPRHFAYAPLTDAEYAVVKEQASRQGLCVANFVRRCINSYLAEQSDDGLLLEEQAHGGPRPHVSRGTSPTAEKTSQR